MCFFRSYYLDSFSLTHVLFEDAHSCPEETLLPATLNPRIVTNPEYCYSSSKMLSNFSAVLKVKHYFRIAKQLFLSHILLWCVKLHILISKQLFYIIYCCRLFRVLHQYWIVWPIGRSTKIPDFSRKQMQDPQNANTFQYPPLISEMLRKTVKYSITSSGHSPQSWHPQNKGLLSTIRFENVADWLHLLQIRYGTILSFWKRF